MTAFEAGKTYHYSVYAYTRELFTVFAADAKLVLNGETIAVPATDAPDSTFVAQYVKELTPKTPTVTPPENNGSTGKPSPDVKTAKPPRIACDWGYCSSAAVSSRLPAAPAASGHNKPRI